MKRLANYDVVRKFRPGVARSGAQIVFGVGCAVVMIALRSTLDLMAPTAGPFALVYPTVLLATLYGRWQAGLISYLVSFFWAWYFVLPSPHSLHFQIDTDPWRVLINAVAALVVLIFAEMFRRAVQSAIFERDAEIERRVVLLQEIEHRTKNNFALAVSLLELQKRQEGPLAQQSLDQAIARLHSFAQAYANLAEVQGDGSSVSMRPYLEGILSKVTRGLFDGNVEVMRDIAPCQLPREVAVAIGLFANEALTNCAKYAFPDGRAGQVSIGFKGNEEGWTLEVADDGIGSGQADATMSSGIGTRLMNAFAAQAMGRYEVETTDSGRLVRLTNCDAER